MERQGMWQCQGQDPPAHSKLPTLQFLSRGLAEPGLVVPGSWDLSRAGLRQKPLYKSKPPSAGSSPGSLSQAGASGTGSKTPPRPAAPILALPGWHSSTPRPLPDAVVLFPNPVPHLRGSINICCHRDSLTASASPKEMKQEPHPQKNRKKMFGLKLCWGGGQGGSSSREALKGEHGQRCARH